MSILGVTSATRPRWVAPTVITIVVFAGLLSSWNIQYAGFSDFYSAAAHSMSQSWRAFAFGAFDPGATITLDKLSGFLIPQALSARLFGFHAWSIALPQVLEGMVTVFAAYLVGSRWRPNGYGIGVLAAAAAATTPLFASMFGHVMEDGLLTMSLTLAFLFWQSAIRNGRMLPLLLSALWVGIGFQAKMMQAWVILPALVIGYIVAAPHPLRTRIVRSAVALTVTILLSLSWMTAIQLISPADRPYIDGSTNNNTYSMVFGYNGFNRIIPNIVPGAVGDRQPSAGNPSTLWQDISAALRPSAGAHSSGSGQANPGQSNAKLVLPYYLTQIGWLYPSAIAGLILGVLSLRRRASERDRRIRLGTIVGLGGWLLVGVVLMSVAKIPHTAYLAAISFQLAILGAIGFTEAVGMLRARSIYSKLVLPALIVVQTAWAAMILAATPTSPTFLLPAVLILGAGAALALVIRAVRGRDVFGRRFGFAVAVALISVLLAPTVWSASTLSVAESGSAGDAYAGIKPPSSAARLPAVQVNPAVPFRIGVPFQHVADTGLSAAQQSLVSYLQARRESGNKPLFATETWQQAIPYLLKTNLNVMAMGGWSQRVDSPTVAALSSLVASGSVNYVIISSSHDMVPGQRVSVYAQKGSKSAVLAYWVHQHCRLIPQSRFETGTTRLANERLYQCGVG